MKKQWDTLIKKASDQQKEKNAWQSAAAWQSAVIQSSTAEWQSAANLRPVAAQ
jgi:hypothetical protein